MIKRGCDRAPRLLSEKQKGPMCRLLEEVYYSKQDGIHTLLGVDLEREATHFAA